MYQKNSKQKTAGGAMLIPNTIDFQKIRISKNKQGHFIMTKMSIHQEDVMILNMCAPKERTLENKTLKLRELKGDVDYLIIVVQNRKTLGIDRTSR